MWIEKIDSICALFGKAVVGGNHVHLRSSLIFFFAITPLLTANAGPVWDKPSLSLGALDSDGGLRQRFELGVLSGSPEFSFSIFLEHGFRAEDAITEYKIPQLETYVVPEGRGQILWLEPGGIRHLFSTEDILVNTPEKQKEPWVAIKVEAGNHEFRSNDGWIYRYEEGSIVSLTAPTGRVLRFETEGLRIRRIFQESDGKEINLLESEDNELSQPVSLRIGPDLHKFQYSETTEHLVKWHSPQMGTQTVAFAYSPKGLIETVTLPDDEKLRYTWGGREGEWQKETGFELPAKDNAAFLIADGDYKFQYGITKAGINLMRTDALDIREGFIFNPRTQQLIRKNRDGGETTEFFGIRGASENRLESARDARGRETVRMTYDEKGRALTKQTPGEAEIRFEYDDLDRITKIFRLNDLHKSYEYLGDSQKPVKVTDALGHTIEIAYTPSGQIDHYKNLDGAVYGFTYDALGQVTEELYPMGYKKTIDRDFFGRITRVKEVNGRETTYQYTAENRLASVNKNGAVWDYEYNPDGDLTRLLKDGETWQKTEREKVVSSGGSILRETDAEGDETVIHFDKNGNLVKQVDALGQKSSYNHDATGQLTGWEDSRGVVAEFERDAIGRVAGVDTGDSTLKMKYDPTGRIRQRKTGEQEIQYKYCPAGRLLQIDYGKGQTIDYTYDSYGRILTALTGQGVKTTYTWNALDYKTSERTDLPGGNWTLLTWTYTPGGKKQSVAVWSGDLTVPGFSKSTSSKIGNQKSSIENPSSSSPIADPQSPIAAPAASPAASPLQKTTYRYDALDRYTGIFVDGEQKIWYEYDPTSLLLTTKRFWNGWQIAYTHHPDGHPKTLLATDGEGKTIKQVAYTWSPEGKLTQRIIDGVEQTYQYDKLGRLTEVINKEQN